MILNGILFLMCVVFFQVACLSLLFGAVPFFFVFAFLFSLCYWGMRDNGPNTKPKQIHLTYYNGDTETETEEFPPFNRDNFGYN